MRRFGGRGVSWWEWFLGLRNNPTDTPFRRRDQMTIDQMYRTFNWAPSKKTIQVEIPDPPKEVFVIGRLPELQYLPIESSGKPHELHTHSFGDFGWKHDKNIDNMPLLVGDTKDNLFIVRDKSQFTLDGPGIVG